MLDSLLAALNPVNAYRNVRGALIENGIVAPPKRTINYKLKTEGMPESTNFVDKTGVTGGTRHQHAITGGPVDLKAYLFQRALEAAQREGQIGPTDYMIEPAPPRKLIDPRKKGAPYL